MSFQTRRFGLVETPGERVIQFKDGIPGLECMRRSILVKAEETRPFYWLQSLEDGDVALPVIDPLIADPSYAPSVDESVLMELELEPGGNPLILAVAVIPQDAKMMTANLAAPLLINVEKNLGRQVILDNPAWPMRQPIYDAVCRKLKEERESAGADPKAE